MHVVSLAMKSMIGNTIHCLIVAYYSPSVLFSTLINRLFPQYIEIQHRYYNTINSEITIKKPKCYVHKYRKLIFTDIRWQETPGRM